MSTQPVIGIAYSDFAKRDNEMRIRTYVSRKYYHALQESGAFVILLPAPLPGNKRAADAHIKKYLSLCSGLLLAGGGDINPRFQNEDPSPFLGATNPFRDEFELELTKQAYKASMPIFGICRGCQLLAMALGGKIYQDITQTAKIQHTQQTPRWGLTHKITVKPSSLLASVIGLEAYTNSFHHQAVKALPKGFIASAQTSDGIIEAIEDTNKGRFALGVQWHPEETFYTDESSKALFKAFVRASEITIEA